MCFFIKGNWKTSEEWFWIKHDRNYILRDLEGWWDTGYFYNYTIYQEYSRFLAYNDPMIRDFWYTVLIPEEEFNFRYFTTTRYASRAEAYEGLWHPFGDESLTPYQAFWHRFYSFLG